MSEELTEKQPWERRAEEPNRWFQRFEAFRLMGSARSIEAVWKDFDASRCKSKRPSSRYYQIARIWDWIERAEAWDKLLSDQAAAAAESAAAAREAAWREKIMGPTETLARISTHGRNDLREFFKISERWTEHPLPTEEVLKDEEREVTISEDQIEMHTFYLVKSVVLDLEALIDPEKSHRVKKFSDSPRSGVSIELYDADDAAALMAKHHKLLTDAVDLNVHADVKGYASVNPDDWDEGETEP